VFFGCVIGVGSRKMEQPK